MSKLDDTDFQQIHRRQRNDFRDNIPALDADWATRVVALYLANHLNHFLNYGLAWPSLERMGRAMHARRSTIARAVKRLAELGIFKIIKATVTEMKPKYTHLPDFKEVRWPRDEHPRNWYQPVWTHPAWQPVLCSNTNSSIPPAGARPPKGGTGSTAQQGIVSEEAHKQASSFQRGTSIVSREAHRVVSDGIQESGDDNPCPNPGRAGQGSHDQGKKLQQSDAIGPHPASGNDDLTVITRLLISVQKNLGLEVPYAVRDHGDSHWRRYASIFLEEVLPHMMKCRNPVGYLGDVIMDDAFGGIDHLNWYSLLSGEYLNRLIGIVKNDSYGKSGRTTVEGIRVYFAEADRQDAEARAADAEFLRHR
jgi:hypothetical protein